MPEQLPCNHTWSLDEMGFYCSHCGRRESVHTFLADLDARRRRDWRSVVAGPAGAEWVHGLADAIEGERGPVTW